MALYTEHDKERIIAIATALLAGKMKKGEVDPNDNQAMERAVKQSVREAAQVYNAALEYVAG